MGYLAFVDLVEWAIIVIITGFAIFTPFPLGRAPVMGIFVRLDNLTNRVRNPKIVCFLVGLIIGPFLMPLLWDMTKERFFNDHPWQDRLSSCLMKTSSDTARNITVSVYYDSFCNSCQDTANKLGNIINDSAGWRGDYAGGAPDMVSVDTTPTVPPGVTVSVSDTLLTSQVKKERNALRECLHEAGITTQFTSKPMNQNPNLSVYIGKNNNVPR